MNKSRLWTTLYLSLEELEALGVVAERNAHTLHQEASERVIRELEPSDNTLPVSFGNGCQRVARLSVTLSVDLFRSLEQVAIENRRSTAEQAAALLSRSLLRDR